MLIEVAGQVLLVRRGAQPGRGRWDVPGGFLEAGEAAEEAARREIREEVGVELGELHLFTVDLNPHPEGDVLDIIYRAAEISGEPRAGSDAAAWAWFKADALPEDLAFATTRRILHRWRMSVLHEAYRLLDGTVLAPAPAHRVEHMGPEWRALPSRWRPECGTWRIHDGLLCGSVDGERPAALWFQDLIAGDHMLIFTASTVPPHANDINCYWDGGGRLEGEARETACTIGGFGGWWRGVTGIERYPEGEMRAGVFNPRLVPGRTYEIAAGRYGDADFFFVDGRLVLQLDEPGRSRRPRAQVALATWNSHVHFSRAAVYRLALAD